MSFITNISAASKTEVRISPTLLTGVKDGSIPTNGATVFKGDGSGTGVVIISHVRNVSEIGKNSATKDVPEYNLDGQRKIHGQPTLKDVTIMMNKNFSAADHRALAAYEGQSFAVEILVREDTTDDTKNESAMFNAIFTGFNQDSFDIENEQTLSFTLAPIDGGISRPLTWSALTVSGTLGNS